MLPTWRAMLLTLWLADCSAILLQLRRKHNGVDALYAANMACNAADTLAR